MRLPFACITVRQAATSAWPMTGRRRRAASRPGGCGREKVVLELLEIEDRQEIVEGGDMG